jgi:2-oxoisovalerate dehydrogenase E1 component beta subunit
MTVKTNIQALHDTLFEEMHRDERIVVLGEDVGVRGGVFRATEGLIDEFGPERVIDSPLSELSIVAVGIGLALNGMRPIAEIQFADFIYPAFNQIVNEAARTRYRSGGDWACPLVIRAPYGGGIGGGLYHSQSIEAFFAHVPGLYVFAPSSPADFAGMLRTALRLEDPVLFLEHKKTYRLIKDEVPDEPLTVPVSQAKVARNGDDVTVVAYGLMFHEAIKAADELAGEGISVEVIDLRTLHPLDKETILKSVEKTGKVVIVHEDNLTGGLGGEVAAIIAQEAFEWLDGPIVRVAGPDVPGVPFSRTMEHFFMPDAARIAAAIRDLAAY